MQSLPRAPLTPRQPQQIQHPQPRQPSQTPQTRQPSQPPHLGQLQTNLDGPPAEPYEPHSPQSTGSPEPPAGVLTDAEAKLWELLLSIHSVQSRFNRPLVNGSTGNGTGVNGGINGNGSAHQQLLLAEPVQAILKKMIEVDEISGQLGTLIPRQAVEDVDNTHHPGHVLKERIEAVSLENAFLNGKIAALSSFRDMLGDALADNFPELESLRRKPTDNVVIKKEEPY